jgi:hypothetical protein
MRSVARFVFLRMLSVFAVAQSESQQHPSQIDREQTAWIASAARKMSYIGTCAWKIKLRGMQAKPGKMYKWRLVGFGRCSASSSAQLCYRHFRHGN